MRVNQGGREVAKSTCLFKRMEMGIELEVCLLVHRRKKKKKEKEKI